MTGQLRNINTFHFPIMAIHGKANCTFNSDEVKLINKKFNNKIPSLQVTDLCIFSSLFDVNIDQALEELQREFIEILGTEDLKLEIELYKSLTRENVLSIVDFARKKMSLLGSRYKYEQLF